jgi:hypothetical protein
MKVLPPIAIATSERGLDGLFLRIACACRAVALIRVRRFCRTGNGRVKRQDPTASIGTKFPESGAPDKIVPAALLWSAVASKLV